MTGLSGGGCEPSSSPGLPSGLHLVGQSHVVGPDIKLPLAQAQHAAVDSAAVDAHPHVHVDARHLPDQPANTENMIKFGRGKVPASSSQSAQWGRRAETNWECCSRSDVGPWL